MVITSAIKCTSQIQLTPDTRPRSVAVSIALTEREQEVLQAIARGERSKEIALHLGIVERTVKSYLSGIYTKLEVDSRAAAVAKALEKGLLPPHSGS